jgi:hypothetical protein
MPYRTCLEPGCPNLTLRTRCVEHERLRQQARNRRRTGYQGDYPRERAAILTRWRAAYGDWCPGLGDADVSDRPDLWRGPHVSADLTVQHRADGSWSVLCRSCNSTAGAVAPVYPHGPSVA